MNNENALDKSLGKGFCIGHSYFCGHDVCTEEWLRSIVDYDILPMLREYWFDEPSKIQRWESIFQSFLSFFMILLNKRLTLFLLQEQSSIDYPLSDI